jgi:hypothetical protein
LIIMIENETGNDEKEQRCQNRSQNPSQPTSFACRPLHNEKLLRNKKKKRKGFNF